MRTIRYTSRLRKITGEKSGKYGKLLDAALRRVLRYLRADIPLPSRYGDHPLSGEWTDYRDCHLKPDLILIYRKTDDGYLDLIRLGSHSELGW